MNRFLRCEIEHPHVSVGRVSRRRVQFEFIRSAYNPQTNLRIFQRGGGGCGKKLSGIARSRKRVTRTQTGLISSRSLASNSRQKIRPSLLRMRWTPTRSATRSDGEPLLPVRRRLRWSSPCPHTFGESLRVLLSTKQSANRSSCCVTRQKRKQAAKSCVSNGTSAPPDRLKR